MELRTNCKNCGASLHYDETNYGKTAICKYCRQEYHVDELGRIEEYKVKIDFMGKVRTFYIESFSVDYEDSHTFYYDVYKTHTIRNQKINLELSTYE